jgi:hypothetical protein
MSGRPPLSTKTFGYVPIFLDPAGSKLSQFPGKTYFILKYGLSQLVMD